MTAPPVAETLPSPSTARSWLKRPGVVLFLVVTALWVTWFALDELGRSGFDYYVFAAALGLSAVSVVVTGYLGELKDALWLGWIPAASTTAVGIALAPAPGDAGDAMAGYGIFLLLVVWPIYFFPLMAFGVAFHQVFHRGGRRSAARS